MTVSAMWDEVEPELRERSYRALDADPQSLLEHDSGGPSVDADLIFARLIGFDEEIVGDGLRLPRIEPVWLMPVMRRQVWTTGEDDPTSLLSLRHAEYRLQSGFVLHHLDAMYAPPWFEVGPPRFTFKVLYLRYRRRG